MERYFIGVDLGGTTIKSSIEKCEEYPHLLSSEKKEQVNDLIKMKPL